MRKDIGTILRIVILGWLFVYSIYSIHFAVTNELWIEYQECGTITGASSEETPIKHGTQTQLYLLMQYDHDGFQAQEVGATTYFQYKDKVGERICFEKSKRNPVIDNNLRNILIYFSGACFVVIYFFI